MANKFAISLAIPIAAMALLSSAQQSAARESQTATFEATAIAANDRDASRRHRDQAKERKHRDSTRQHHRRRDHRWQHHNGGRQGVNDRRDRQRNWDHDRSRRNGNWRQRDRRRSSHAVRHRDRHRWQHLHHNRRSHHKYHGPRWRAPRGYHYRHWRWGQHLPRIYYRETYWLTDFLLYGLFDPPAGLVWVRYGPDALLVDRYTGEIVQVRYGVFYY